MRFVHLRLHTEYSLNDSTVRLKPLMASCKEKNMPAVAMTDRMNLYALVKFYNTAMATGLKPLLGADIHVQEDESATFHHLILLCQNNQGYRNLTKLISKAYLEGQAHQTPLLKKAWVAEYSEGLIALSGGREGDIGQSLLAANPDNALTYLQDWRKIFPQRFYLELQRTQREGEEDYLHQVIDLAIQTKTPVVATNDVRFLQSSDFNSHEARVCISGGYVLDDPNRPKLYSDQQYLKTPEEMCELFADIPEAIENTLEIAKRCNVSLTLGKNYLPEFPIPAGLTEAEFFCQESRKGLEERLDFLLDRTQADFIEKRQPYDERLDIELGVINEMGFPGYFLIVADFIQWAKDNDIPVGPGRGSGAGSLVAYALKITDLDPLEYDLLFERFLNPERVSMPDFDIDFCMDNRDRVIDYVSRHYGKEKVSQIITYGSMAAKAVIRDVGRVYGHPYGFVDRIAKQIPFEVGMTLTKALEASQDLKTAYDEDEEVRAVLDMGLSLEGLSKNVGKHAGGVLISPSDLTDFTPLYCEADGTGVMSQYDKNDVEAVGLVKFDFLGLRILTIIDWALKTLNKKRKKQNLEPIYIESISLEDKASFDLLKAQKTTAVFQLESRGMKELIKRLQPDVFEDIIALVALYRPGPLGSGMVDDFVNRKHGVAKVEYPHPDLEPVLEPTYGIILYQEQVMQIAQVLGNFSLGGADLLRRAMGKKKPEEMEKQRSIFMKGALENEVEESLATYIFDLMEKFSGYGFNKSHSAAYALVSYQTAWLKSHYPAEFMAAVLSADMDNTEKVVMLIDDCRQLEINIVAPDINQSHYRFSVNDAGDIVYGLGAIKGAGEAILNLITQEREDKGNYRSLADLCQRISAQKINRRILETLIKAGAFDNTGANRNSLMAFLPEALRMSNQHHRAKGFGQSDLFGGAMAIEQDQQVCPVLKEWPERQRLDYEKKSLGLYLTGHPIKEYQAELQQMISHRLVELAEIDEEQRYSQQPVLIAGLVSDFRFQNTDKGKRAFITLDDQSAYYEMLIFSDVLEQFETLICKDELLIIEGKLNSDWSGKTRLRVETLHDMYSARNTFARNLVLSIDRIHPEKNSTDLDKIEDDLIQTLREFIDQQSNSSCPIIINYTTATEQTHLRLGSQYHAPLQCDVIQKMRQAFGQNSITIKY
jgi:DNA polymerase-3 subunit alpha